MTTLSHGRPSDAIAETRHFKTYTSGYDIQAVSHQRGAVELVLRQSSEFGSGDLRNVVFRQHLTTIRFNGFKSLLKLSDHLFQKLGLLLSTCCSCRRCFQQHRRNAETKGNCSFHGSVLVFFRFFFLSPPLPKESDIAKSFFCTAPGVLRPRSM